MTDERTVAGRLGGVAVGLGMVVVVLLGVEVLAHLVLGDAPPYDLFVRISQCGVDVRSDEAMLDCHPGEAEDVVVSAQPAQRPRVVILGGSSMRQPRERNVPIMLGRQMPDIEVINFAVSGMSVANIARISSQLEALRPDLLVISAGHNEYSGDAFRGAIQGSRLSAIPLYALIQKSWIHGWLARAPRGAGRHQPRREHIVWTEDRTALDLRPDLDARYRSDLSLAITHAPAPVLITTLLRNPDFPPTGLYAPGRADCQTRGPDLVQSGGPWAHRAREATSLCGETALTWWLRSRAARQSGDLQTALSAFAQSTELDPIPLRAPVQADGIVRDVAAAHGATVVDLAGAFGPFPPANYFTDAVHFSNPGTEAVAKVLGPHIRRALEATERR